jgi:DNA invertase Pin-like site-specific DNA recombinase
MMKTIEAPPRAIAVAIYVRISQDRTGAGLGVARQEEDCRVLCERLGWNVVEIYIDNDVSAFSGKPRPEWERLMADVKAGHVQGVAVWHIDRLTRSPRELEDVIDLADRHSLALATVTGEVDLATPTGRMIGRIIGSVARQESEHKAERQARERRQSAERGHRNGGGLRGYGYEGDKVVEDEAVVIVDAARRVLAGESLSSVCRSLKEWKILTAGGTTWIPSKLQKVLMSARISGRREHHGEIVSDTATWPAIISPEDSDRLRALLGNPARRTSTSTGRKYLLAGILKCGRCGGRMATRPRDGVRRYVCAAVAGGDSCGRMAINGEKTDEFVRDMVLIALDSPGMAERLRERDGVGADLIEAIRRDEEEMEEIAADKAEGRITRKEWLVQREIVVNRLDAARRRLARQTQTNALTSFVGTFEEMQGRWEGLNVSQRRAIVSAVLVSLKVNPATHGPKWDPERLAEPEWRV